MSLIVVGLVRDAHEARALVRALEDEGFELDALDVSADLFTGLLARGVPEKEAGLYAEGVRRGGMLVFVRAVDDDQAAEAAEIMAEHGAPDGRIYHDPRNYDGRERRKSDEPYDGVDRRAI